MMVIKTINIKTFDLKNDKPTVLIRNQVSLFETHLEWDIKCFSDMPKDTDDPTLGWEEVETNHRLKLKKISISMIERYYTRQTKVFVLAFAVPGNRCDFDLKFQTEEEADSVFEQLTEWWLN